MNTITTTIAVAIIAILVVKNWDWIEIKFEWLWGILGKLFIYGCCALLVWGGAELLHWLFSINYVIGGIITLAGIMIYGKRN